MPTNQARPCSFKEISSVQYYLVGGASDSTTGSVCADVGEGSTVVEVWYDARGGRRWRRDRIRRLAGLSSSRLLAMISRWPQKRARDSLMSRAPPSFFLICSSSWSRCSSLLVSSIWRLILSWLVRRITFVHWLMMRFFFSTIFASSFICLQKCR